MLRQNLISFPSIKVFFIGFLFCSVVSFDIMGQEEREIDFSESNQGHDVFFSPEGSELYGPEEKTTENKASKVRALNEKETEKENKHEQLYQYKGEKEVNKEGMSTLSFNLFLYVVDKFKEDN